MTLGRVQQLHQSGRATISSRAPWAFLFTLEILKVALEVKVVARRGKPSPTAFKREGREWHERKRSVKGRSADALLIEWLE